MQTYYCRDGCCVVQTNTYKSVKRFYNRNYRKAGVFIYDPKEKRVLLVQSRGHLWGPPKGSLNIDEKEIDCAIREVKEETGLNISNYNFSHCINIRNRAVYYYVEMNTCAINVQDDMEDNDANGITWIKVSCLENAIIDGNMVLNHYAKIVFWKFLNKTFPKSTWTKIINKRKNKPK